MEHVRLFEYEAGKPLPLIVALGGDMLSEDGDALWHALTRDMDKGACRAFNVAALDWPGDGGEYAPWPGELPRGETSGGADKYLAYVKDEVLPYAQSKIACTDEIVLVGYSLAGLCAMYAAYAQGDWRGIACMSGSLWFGGWADFVKAHSPVNANLRVYLSLGNKESRARNPIMRSVGENTQLTCDMLTSQLKPGEVTYITEPGGHFTDPQGRWQRALRWLMQPEQ